MTKSPHSENTNDTTVQQILNKKKQSNQDKEKAYKSQTSTEQTSTNQQGFILNETDIEVMQKLIQEKSNLMAKIINTESTKQTFIKVGALVPEEQSNIAESFFEDIEAVIEDFGKEITSADYKKKLSPSFQGLQLTGTTD